MNVRLAGIGAVVVLALVAYLGLRPSADASRRSAPAANEPAARPVPERAASAPHANASSTQAFDAPPAARAAKPASTTPLPPVVPDAALSLADALRDGDARTPPIARDETHDQPPTVAELADPAAYRRYEARRQARVHRAFEREATIALADQRRDLDLARAQGAPPEILAEGEEKAQKLAQTLRRLREGQLDGDRPAEDKK